MMKRSRIVSVPMALLCALLLSCASAATAGSYNKGVAASYARQYANWPNLNFPYFSENDCTNFVSQAIAVGQEQFSYSNDPAKRWFYTGRYAYSRSWTLAHDLFIFLRSAGRGDVIGEGVCSNRGNYNSLEPGDLIFGSRNDTGSLSHVLIVTGRNWRGILVSAHTNNRLDSPFIDVLNPINSKGWRFYYFRMRSQY